MLEKDDGTCGELLRPGMATTGELGSSSYFGPISACDGGPIRDMKAAMGGVGFALHRAPACGSSVISSMSLVGLDKELSEIMAMFAVPPCLPIPISLAVTKRW